MCKNKFFVLALVLALILLSLVSCDGANNFDKTFISKAFKDLTWNSTIDDVKLYFKDEGVKVETKEGGKKENNLSYVETTLTINDATVMDIKSKITFSFYNLTFEDIEYDYGLYGVEIGFLSSDKVNDKINEVFEEEKKNAVKSSPTPNEIGMVTYSYEITDYTKISKETIDVQRKLHSELHSVFTFTDKDYYNQPLIGFYHTLFERKISEDSEETEKIHKIRFYAEKYKMIQAVGRQMNSK